MEQVGQGHPQVSLVAAHWCCTDSAAFELTASQARQRLAGNLRVLDLDGGHDRIHGPSLPVAASRVNPDTPRIDSPA